MLRIGSAAGLAGLIVLSSMAVHAEDAKPQAEPARECSGLSCIFGRTFSQTTPPVAAQPQAPTAAQQAEAQAAAASAKLDVDAATNALDRKLSRERREKARVAAREARAKAARAGAIRQAKVKAASSNRIVTIAADTAELDRLKGLAKAMPKDPIRLVPAADGGAADLSVVAKLDPARHAAGPKLFVEQLHIVGGATIRSIADLEGKTVSFGPEGGASQGAARKAFAALGVAVKETPLDFDNALDGVGTGDLAALVLLAPQPAERLRTVSGLHLVAWPENAAPPKGAVAATIDGSAYPGLAKAGEKIRAIGVEAVLSVNPGGSREPAARTFMNALAEHSASLSRHGFDLLEADVAANASRRVASGERR